MRNFSSCEKYRITPQRTKKHFVKLLDTISKRFTAVTTPKGYYSKDLEFNEAHVFFKCFVLTVRICSFCIPFVSAIQTAFVAPF